MNLKPSVIQSMGSESKRVKIEYGRINKQLIWFYINNKNFASIDDLIKYMCNRLKIAHDQTILYMDDAQILPDEDIHILRDEDKLSLRHFNFGESSGHIAIANKCTNLNSGKEYKTQGTQTYDMSIKKLINKSNQTEENALNQILDSDNHKLMEISNQNSNFANRLKNINKQIFVKSNIDIGNFEANKSLLSNNDIRGSNKSIEMDTLDSNNVKVNLIQNQDAIQTINAVLDDKDNSLPQQIDIGNFNSKIPHVKRKRMDKRKHSSKNKENFQNKHIIYSDSDEEEVIPTSRCLHADLNNVESLKVSKTLSILEKEKLNNNKIKLTYSLVSNENDMGREDLKKPFKILNKDIRHHKSDFTNYKKPYLHKDRNYQYNEPYVFQDYDIQSLPDIPIHDLTSQIYEKIIDDCQNSFANILKDNKIVNNVIEDKSYLNSSKSEHTQHKNIDIDKISITKCDTITSIISNTLINEKNPKVSIKVNGYANKIDEAMVSKASDYKVISQDKKEGTKYQAFVNQTIVHNGVYDSNPELTPVKERIKSSGTFPNSNLLSNPPRVGNKILYKILELDQNYNPIVSKYKEAMVLNYDRQSNTLSLQNLSTSQDKRPNVKFEMPDSGESDMEQSGCNGDTHTDISIIKIEWDRLIEPQLVC